MAAARSGDTSGALVTVYVGMWIYLAPAFGVLIAFSVFVAAVLSVPITEKFPLLGLATLKLR